MRSASFAEWIIACFTTKARAASIIGDLLEAVPQKGKLWFWLSVAGVFFSLTWRPALALAVTFCLWKYRWRATVSAKVLSPSELASEIASYHPPTLTMLFYMYLYSLGFQLRLGTFYMAIRYGLKDVFVRHTLAAWLLVGFVAQYSYTSPRIAIACVALASCAFVYLAVSAQRRKGLLALACVILFLFAWDKFSGPVVLIVVRAILAIAPSMIWSVGLLIGLFAQTFAFATAHRLFFEKNSCSSENEPPGNAQLSVDIS
jgi:hypothetical protein